MSLAVLRNYSCALMGVLALSSPADAEQVVFRLEKWEVSAPDRINCAETPKLSLRGSDKLLEASNQAKLDQVSAGISDVLRRQCPDVKEIVLEAGKRRRSVTLPVRGSDKVEVAAASSLAGKVTLGRVVGECPTPVVLALNVTAPADLDLASSPAFRAELVNIWSKVSRQCRNEILNRTKQGRAKPQKELENISGILFINGTELGGFVIEESLKFELLEQKLSGAGPVVSLDAFEGRKAALQQRALDNTRKANESIRQEEEFFRLVDEIHSKYPQPRLNVTGLSNPQVFSDLHYGRFKTAKPGLLKVYGADVPEPYEGLNAPATKGFAIRTIFVWYVARFVAQCRGQVAGSLVTVPIYERSMKFIDGPLRTAWGLPIGGFYSETKKQVSEIAVPPEFAAPLAYFLENSGLGGIDALYAGKVRAAETILKRDVEAIFSQNSCDSGILQHLGQNLITFVNEKNSVSWTDALAQARKAMPGAPF